MEKNKAKLEEKIKKVLGDIDQQIQQDNQETNQQEVPQKIDSNLLKQKLGEINQKLKESSKSTQKQLQKLQEEHLPRLEKYEQQLQTLGDRNSFSKTDEDTHFSIHQKPNDTTTLSAHLEGFKQKYNKQSRQVVADSGYGSLSNRRCGEL